MKAELDNQEMISLIYVSLACAAGGRDLLDRSNDILRTAVDTNRISRPETRRAIKVLLALTESAAPA